MHNTQKSLELPVLDSELRCEKVVLSALTSCIIAGLPR